MIAVTEKQKVKMIKAWARRVLKEIKELERLWKEIKPSLTIDAFHQDFVSLTSKYRAVELIFNEINGPYLSMDERLAVMHHFVTYVTYAKFLDKLADLAIDQTIPSEIQKEMFSSIVNDIEEAFMSGIDKIENLLRDYKAIKRVVIKRASIEHTGLISAHDGLIVDLEASKQDKDHAMLAGSNASGEGSSAAQRRDGLAGNQSYFIKKASWFAGVVFGAVAGLSSYVFAGEQIVKTTGGVFVSLLPFLAWTGGIFAAAAGLVVLIFAFRNQYRWREILESVASNRVRMFVPGEPCQCKAQKTTKFERYVIPAEYFSRTVFLSLPGNQAVLIKEDSQYYGSLRLSRLKLADKRLAKEVFGKDREEQLLWVTTLDSSRIAFDLEKRYTLDLSDGIRLVTCYGAFTSKDDIEHFICKKLTGNQRQRMAIGRVSPRHQEGGSRPGQFC